MGRGAGLLSHCETVVPENVPVPVPMAPMAVAVPDTELADNVPCCLATV
jgi:hypothetical protein